MKNNLVKLLAVGALIASLGACGGKKGPSEESKEQPKVVTIDEFYEVDFDEETFEISAPLDGQLVTLEDHTLIGYHGRTVYTSYTDGDYLENLHGIEFRLAEDFEFDWATAQRDVVDVTGRVSFENGVCVLNDATYVVKTEGVYNKTKQEWNNPAYYWPAKYMTRPFWGQYTANYNLHAVISEGKFQVATAPTWADGQDTTFYVVFPGEDPDVENYDNLCPIKVTVPGDLVPAKRTAIKKVLDTIDVGEYFYSHFIFNDSLDGMGIMLENVWGAGYIEKTTKVNIIKTWEDVAKKVKGMYVVDIPDFGIDEFALSYSVNTDLWNQPLTKVWKDPTQLGFGEEEIANWAFTDYIINFAAAKRDDAIAAFNAKMTAAGFVSGGVQEDTQAWVKVEGEGEDEVETAVVYEFMNATNIEFYYVALRGEGPAAPALDEPLAKIGSVLVSALSGNSAYTPEYVLEKMVKNDEDYGWMVAVNWGTSISVKGCMDEVTSVLSGAEYQCISGGFKAFSEGNGGYALFVDPEVEELEDDTIVYEIDIADIDGKTYMMIFADLFGNMQN